jgi:hypothetical protein
MPETLSIDTMTATAARMADMRKRHEEKYLSNLSRRASVRMPSVTEGRSITKAAISDPDALPKTQNQLKAMVPLRSLRPYPEAKKLRVPLRYRRWAKG